MGGLAPLDEAALEMRLNGPVVEPGVARDEPDPVWIHVEKMRPGVTLELLHIEYLESHPNGLRYTAFCDRYRAWLARRKLTMRQVHKAGVMNDNYQCRSTTITGAGFAALTA